MSLFLYLSQIWWFSRLEYTLKAFRNIQQLVIVPGPAHQFQPNRYTKRCRGRSFTKPSYTIL